MTPARISRYALPGLLVLAAVLVVSLGIALAGRAANSPADEPARAAAATITESASSVPTPSSSVPTPSPSVPTPFPSVPTPSSSSAPTSPGAPTPTPTPSPTASPTPTRTPEKPAPAPDPALSGPQLPSGQTKLVQVQSLTGNLSSKSVVANDTGTLFAQNMMYQHTISVFDADGALVKTIPDSVELAEYGIEGHPGTSRGAPVEMAFSPDGRTGWVSNYSMYGEGFGPEGSDECSSGDGYDNSYLYEVDVASLEIVDAIEVGAVPKYVATTPDGSRVLVTNWCTWDLSVVDTATSTEIARIPLDGSYPRGIEVSPDSNTAWIAMMGADRIAKVDLQSLQMTDASWSEPGDGPRHLVLSPDGRLLYVTNNSSGNVVKLDAATGEALGSVGTGVNARSMDISTDGEALYVVNYKSETLSKVRTSDMTVVQEVATNPKPIGITYEPTLRRVWVANYSGTLQVFDDSHVLAD